MLLLLGYICLAELASIALFLLFERIDFCNNSMSGAIYGEVIFDRGLQVEPTDRMLDCNLIYLLPR